MLLVFFFGMAAISIDYIFFVVDGRVGNRRASRILTEIDVDSRLLEFSFL